MTNDERIQLLRQYGATPDSPRRERIDAFFSAAMNDSVDWEVEEAYEWALRQEWALQEAKKSLDTSTGS